MRAGTRIILWAFGLGFCAGMALLLLLIYDASDMGGFLMRQVRPIVVSQMRQAHASYTPGQHLSAQDLLRYQGCECLYLKNRSVPSCLDGNGEIWSGKLHNSGIFPVLGRTDTGFVQTVVADREHTPTRYQVVFIIENQLTFNFRNTYWYRATHDFNVTPEAPQLCPNPQTILLARR